jgi:hypothetical protein
MVRRLLVPLTVLGLLAFVPSTASAGFPQPTCSVDDDTPSAGQVVTTSGDFWSAGSRVRIKFAQQGQQTTPLDAARADSGGSFVEDVTIPGGASLGSAQLIFKGRNVVDDGHGCKVFLTIVP